MTTHTHTQQLAAHTSEPGILAGLMDDVMWDQRVRVGGVAPAGHLGEAAIALGTVQYLVVPGWAEDLHCYQAIMDTLRPTPEPEHGDATACDGPADDMPGG